MNAAKSARATVIVPCYNDGRLVIEAVASIEESSQWR